MGTLTAFRSLRSAVLSRMAWLRDGGLGYDSRRNYYEALGYDPSVTTRMYRAEYMRGGIAKRIVEAFPKATWRGGVELFEDEDDKITTPFEQAWNEHFVKRLNIWSTFLKADILAGLSTYSVILIGDGGDLSQELAKGKPEKLLYLQPYGGGGGATVNSKVQALATDADCTISTWDIDPKSPRFAEPQTYTLRRSDIPSLQKPIHHSRIVHVAEGCLEDNVFGMPTLENVWNYLQDLLKVAGGGAEAFWLRANQGLNLNLDKDVDMKPEDEAALKDEVDEYVDNQRRVLKTRGMSVTTLGSDVANFSGPMEAILTLIAGSKGIPMRILTGSERGELASTQDAANFNTQVQDRRTNYAGPLIVRRLVDRMIQYGYLPTPKQYDVFWPTVQTMSDVEKAEGAKIWAMTNQVNGRPVYTDDEIRGHWHDYEPLTATQKAAMAPEAAPNGTDSKDVSTEDKLKAAELASLGARIRDDESLAATLVALEAAIEADDLGEVGRLIGLSEEVIE